MGISSSSLYGSQINKGTGGLMSGLDTDELVKQMTARTRNKISKQYQAKQKLLYRQEAYRDISTKLTSFNDKYFSFAGGSKSNILSANFFKAYSIESSSKYVNVSGDENNINNFSIDEIMSVASKAGFASNKKISDQSFESTKEFDNYMSSLAGQTMSINYDGKTYNLAIDKEFGRGNTETDLGAVAKQLNEQIDKIKDLNGGTNTDTSDNKVLFEIKGDKLVLTGKELIDPPPTDPAAEKFKTATLAGASNKIIDALKLTVGEKIESKEAITSPEDLAKLTRTKEQMIFDGSITFDYNGSQKTISLSGMFEPKLDQDGKPIPGEPGALKAGYTADAAGVAKYMQEKADKLIGLGKVKISETGGKIGFETTSDTDLFGISGISGEFGNYVGLESATYNRINRSKGITDAGLKDILTPSGKMIVPVKDQYGNNVKDEFGNDVTEEVDAYKIKINDVEFAFRATDSLSTIIDTINKNEEAGVNIYHSSTTDTFTVKATETGSHKGVKIEDVTGGNLAAALFGEETVDYTVKAGTDTEMKYTLNGIQTTVKRSSDSFTVDGINIELNEKAAGSITAGDSLKFDVKNNVDEVVEKVKEFVKDYNAIIDALYSKTSEKPAKGYDPLTPEQAEEMKEDQIKNWDKEAKKGVLFGDRNMSNILNDLRGTMTGGTTVSNLLVSDIGIEAMKGLDMSGKLSFDEEKFKEKLAQNQDAVIDLFTGSTTDPNGIKGIALQLQDIIKENVGSFGGDGILIREAGIENTVSADKNFISETVADYDEMITKLQVKLKTERERYWAQFTNLEKTLSNLNAQSSWLTQQS